jgi:hypothetical protein
MLNTLTVVVTKMATEDNLSDVDFVLETQLMNLDAVTSKRKIRLFCCACTRRAWKLLSRYYQHTVEVAEVVSDSPESEENMLQLYSVAEKVDVSHYRRKCARRAAAWCVHPDMSAVSIARSVASSVSKTVKSRDVERRIQLELLRDIIGSQSIQSFDDTKMRLWRTGAVVDIAASAYENRLLPLGHIDSHKLGELADALEDAGCSDADILAHCRGLGPHVRGCWVVDLILGKQ